MPPGLGRRDESARPRGGRDLQGNVERKAREEAEKGRSRTASPPMQLRADMTRMVDAFEDAVGEIVETVSSALTELEASATASTLTAAVLRN